MKTRTYLETGILVIGAVVIGTSPAFATTVSIPEPSMLSLYGAAVAGLVVAGRWMRRK